MKVEYLFSRNKKMGSRLISWASTYEQLNELPKDKIPSHVGVLLNDRIVIESVLGKGVRLIPYGCWKKINEELYKIPCAQKYRQSTEVMDHLLEVWGKPYDWKGILFFCWSFIKLILKGESLPKKNLWQRATHFFCSEFAGRLSNHSFEMTTPAKMCDNFLKGELE